MSIAELKKSIYKKVEGLDDTSLLDAINELLTHDDNIFQIPEKSLPGINQGKLDYKNGNFLPLEEFEQKYEIWLNN